MHLLRSSKCLLVSRVWSSGNLSRNVSTTSKPFYITTPIFYPNALPHIGHLYSLVTGDVFARYQRLKTNGQEVRYLAGTDEHGLKIQKAARAYFGGESGRDKEFCDMLSERFRDLGKRANVSNTCFMRTSSKEHHEAVENVWRNLRAKGYIYKSQYSGWYSVTDECFYTDAQVVDGVSLETGAAVEWAEEENYMFRLSAFREKLLEHFTRNKRSVYPEQYLDNVIGMLGGKSTNGPSDDAFVLEDLSISRPRSRLEWGVQVPDDPQQTVYVWFDALLIYLTGSGYPWTSVAQQTAQGWPADIQIIGKDILRFHAIYLPAIILALSGKATEEVSSLPIALPKTLLTHAHWTSSQKKMSKSLGNVADPLEAMEKFGVDVVRFYMMRIGGRWRADVDWSTEQLQKHQKEISAQLGNYFLRVTSPRIAERASQASTNGFPLSFNVLFEDRAGKAREQAQDTDKVVMAEDEDPNVQLLAATLALPAKVRMNMDELEAGQALAEIMNVLKLANKTVADVEPWAKSTPPSVTHTTRTVALETLRIVGACLAPFMPDTSQRLMTGLGLDLKGCPASEGGSSPKGVLELASHRPVEKDDMEAIWQRWAERKVEGAKLFL